MNVRRRWPWWVAAASAAMLIVLSFVHVLSLQAATRTQYQRLLLQAARVEAEGLSAELLSRQQRLQALAGSAVVTELLSGKAAKMSELRTLAQTWGADAIWVLDGSGQQLAQEGTAMPELSAVVTALDGSRSFAALFTDPEGTYIVMQAPSGAGRVIACVALSSLLPGDNNVFDSSCVYVMDEQGADPALLLTQGVRTAAPAEWPPDGGLVRYMDLGTQVVAVGASLSIPGWSLCVTAYASEVYVGLEGGLLFWVPVALATVSLGLALFLTGIGARKTVPQAGVPAALSEGWGLRLADSLPRRQEFRYRQALENANDLVFEVDTAYGVLLSSLSQWRDFFGGRPTPDYNKAIRLAAQRSVHPEDQQAFIDTFGLDRVRSALGSGQRQLYLEYRRLRHPGQYVWYSCLMVPVYDSGSQYPNAVGTLQNINDRKRAEIELTNRAQKDGLTGLYNRTSAQAMAEECLAAGGTHGLILIDIDDFKAINDRQGHLTGDGALCAIAQLLRRVFRTTDILGRIGGDEFLVLMRDISEEKAVNTRLNGLYDALREPILVGDISCVLSLSAGAALAPRDGDRFQTLFQQADEALYQAKRQGKGTFRICEGRQTG